jgi:hypothetical protein
MSPILVAECVCIARANYFRHRSNPPLRRATATVTVCVMDGYIEKCWRENLADATMEITLRFGRETPKVKIPLQFTVYSCSHVKNGP